MHTHYRVVRFRKIQPAPPAHRESKRKTWPIVATFVTQGAVLAVLLYLIGWNRARATTEHFGVDISRLANTPADYLLRSLNSVAGPALVFAVCTVAFLALNRRLVRALDRPPHDRGRRSIELALPATGPTGGILLVIGAVGVLVNATPGWPQNGLPPLLIFLGAGILSYGAHLDRSRAEREPGDRIRAFTLIFLCFISLLLIGQKYAEFVGRTIAVNDAQMLQERPAIRLHSTKRLDIGDKGVQLSYDSSPEQYFHYRYDGLRLLTYNNNHFFLVSQNWEKGKSMVIPVRDNDTVRVDHFSSPER
ncbi:hypothetical protein ACIBCH_19055 [Amycolatopsis thailandensis]|uniref:hypothetical protein n=1 Tax=Amycolatopsis thailandensis TaxID=589330 RepID=UPI0037A50C9B